MSCGYNCEYNCEDCDVPDKVIEFVKGYNQALEDFTRQLSVRLVELPLDDLIVADILNDVKGIYERLKR